ncbi:hypothetical protein GCK32_022636, partial [Trichostrongylus colubriformis]
CTREKRENEFQVSVQWNWSWFQRANFVVLFA